MNAALLALGLYQSSGGPSKSVAAFQRALSAKVISWVDPQAFAKEPQIWDRLGVTPTVVRASRLPLMQQLGYPCRAGLTAAERVVAASSVVSCHSFWRWHNVWLEKVAARHRVPYWFVPHGALDPYVLEKQPIVKRTFLSMGARRFLDGAATVVCATRREHEKLASFMPITPAAIVPWPLHEADFRQQDEATRAVVRRRLGIPEGCVVFLLFGRLDPMKRPLETISTFAESAAGDAHLIIVGETSGVSRQECEHAARAANVANRVHVVGAAYGADRMAYLDAADVYVSLSHRENFNFTAAEAMASGIPVILSPGNDLGPDIADVGCGWILDSIENAGSAIAAASTSSQQSLELMGSRGRTWAEANLRDELFASRIRALATALA